MGPLLLSACPTLFLCNLARGPVQRVFSEWSFTPRRARLSGTHPSSVASSAEIA